MPELLYKRPGRLELIRYRDNARFLYNGIVRAIAPSITPETTTVEDGNSDWGIELSAGKTAQVRFDLNSFQPKLYAALSGGTYDEGTTEAVRRIDEFTVPAATPYTVTLPKTPDAATIAIANEDDSPFTKGASATGVGVFAVSGTTLTFHASDAGKEIIVAYDTNLSTAHMKIPSSSLGDVFRVVVAGDAVTAKNEGVQKADAFILDRARVTGELSMPPRQKDVAGWSFTMRVLKPRNGFQAVDYIVEK